MAPNLIAYALLAVAVFVVLRDSYYIDYAVQRHLDAKLEHWQAQTYVVPEDRSPASRDILGSGICPMVCQLITNSPYITINQGGNTGLTGNMTLGNIDNKDVNIISNNVVGLTVKAGGGSVLANKFGLPDTTGSNTFSIQAAPGTSAWTWMPPTTAPTATNQRLASAGTTGATDWLSVYSASVQSTTAAAITTTAAQIGTFTLTPGVAGVYAIHFTGQFSCTGTAANSQLAVEIYITGVAQAFTRKTPLSTYSSFTAVNNLFPTASIATRLTLLATDSVQVFAQSVTGNGHSMLSGELLVTSVF